MMQSRGDISDLAMSKEPDKSADDLCKSIDSGSYDLATRAEPHNPAHEMPELPTGILGGVDSVSDEELMKCVDGLAKALKEWRDNPSRRKELWNAKLQIPADILDAMIEQARSSLPKECGGVLAGHSNIAVALYPLG